MQTSGGAVKGDEPIFSCGKAKAAVVSSVLTEWLSKGTGAQVNYMNEEEELLHNFIEQNLTKTSDLYRKVRALISGKAIRGCDNDGEVSSAVCQSSDMSVITPLPSQISGAKRAHDDAVAESEGAGDCDAKRLFSDKNCSECSALENHNGICSCCSGCMTTVNTPLVQPAKVFKLMRKRADVIQWDDYFMSVAFLSAMRSKDPSTQVGACVVNQDKRIVGIGYNGFPRGCSDDELPWSREAENQLDTKYLYVCHAEMNAILNKNSADVKGCTIFVALFPCNDCAKIIIQSGISEVVYLSDKYKDKAPFEASRRLLNMAKVRLRQLQPKSSSYTIDFSALE